MFFTFVMHVKPVQGESTGGIEIKNIQTLPHAIMEGHLFKVNATLVNNSPNPILVENGACDAPFSVTFNNHVLVQKNDTYCTLQMIMHKIDSGDEMTFTSPYSALSFLAASGGPINATITFPYEMWNQENKSYGKQSISESFSFTIWNRTKTPTLSSSENQTIVETALAIPGLQQWSHDWRYVSMGFLGNNKLGTPYFKWQYAILNLKAPSSSAPLPCENDWWAWVDIDMTTMKVVQATYPTMESHGCQLATGGGPGTLGEGSFRNLASIQFPLKQFKSGISLDGITCKAGLFLAISNEKNPLCLKPGTISKLASRGLLYEAPRDSETTILIPPGSEDPSSNKTYSPNNTTVVIGINSTVTWVNQAIAGNSIVSDMPVVQDLNTFGSSLLRPGDSYRYAFSEPGTFHYHGVPHPWQKGTINVLSIPIQVNLTSQQRSNAMAILGNNAGTITLGTRTHYFETTIYSSAAHRNHSQISFHSVTFNIFLTGFRDGLPVPDSVPSSTVPVLENAIHRVTDQMKGHAGWIGIEKWVGDKVTILYVGDPEKSPYYNPHLRGVGRYLGGTGS